jgi:hypothetical protein
MIVKVPSKKLVKIAHIVNLFFAVRIPPEVRIVVQHHVQQGISSREQRPALIDRSGGGHGLASEVRQHVFDKHDDPAFVFLAAPSCSSYITGEILPIIGGYSGG